MDGFFTFLKFVGGFLCFIWLVSTIPRFINKHIAAERWRKGYSEEADFFSPLRAKGVPEEIAHHVLAWFRKWEGDENFPVKANDRISRVYGIEHPDDEDMLIELSDTLGRELDLQSPEMLAEMNKVFTIEDLAVFITNLPSKKEI